MDEVKWPVLFLSRGIMWVERDLHAASVCTTLAVCNGCFVDMKLIDSTGNVFLVRQIQTIPPLTRWRRILVQLYNPRLKVEYTDVVRESQMNLQEFKRLVVKKIDSMEEENNAWSGRGSVSVLKRTVLAASDYRKVMQILTSERYLPDEPQKGENTDEGAL